MTQTLGIREFRDNFTRIAREGGDPVIVKNQPRGGLYTRKGRQGRAGRSLGTDRSARGAAAGRRVRRRNGARLARHGPGR